MEHIVCELNPEMFDKAVHGGLDDKPTLPEAGDLAIYFKPNATVGGKPMAVLTFSVELPDGKKARAQCTTTLALLEMVFGLINGWKARGDL